MAYSDLINMIEYAGTANQRATEQKQRELNLAIGQNTFQQVQDQQNEANALRQFAAPLGGVAGPGAPGAMGEAPVEAPSPDPDKVAFEYYTKIAPDPVKASLVLDNVAKRAKEVLERTGDPEQMIAYTNSVTGRTDKFAGFKGTLLQIKNEDGTTQLVEYEPQGGKLTDRGTVGRPKLISVGEKSRLYDPTLGKVIVEGVADDANVPVKSEHNLRGKDGQPVTKLWYKGGRTEEIRSVPSPGSVVIANAQRAQREFRNEMDMRKEFLSLPEVKEFPVVEKQLGRVQAAFDEVKRGAPNKIAVDQTLVTAFNKMMDESSVVRESEYARTASDAPWFNKIRGKFEKFSAGGAGLTDEDRTALYDMIQNFGRVAKEGYESQVDFYSELAGRYGFQPRNVVRLGGAEPRKGGAPKESVKSKTPIGTVEDGYIFMGGDDTKQENWRKK